MYLSVVPRAALACLLFCLPVYSTTLSFSGYNNFTSDDLSVVDPGPILNQNSVCNNKRFLTAEQLELCKMYPDVVASALQGVRMAIRECQHQFANRRWNCSTLPEFINNDPLSSGLLARGVRETAFVHAIISAGITQVIGKSCSMGNLSSCGCDHKDYGRGPPGWNWDGCSDNTEYGAKIASKFLDSREKRRDIKSLMNLHNNRAGRLAVLSNMKVDCKCVGPTGSCSVKICWKTVPKFRDVGRILKENFDSAIKIRLSDRKSGRIRIKPAYRWSVKPEDFKRELVYFENSPNYCEKNCSLNIPGTKGRVCKVDSLDIGGCELLCCGRGYDTLNVTITKRGPCRYYWCCHVLCEKLEANASVTVCK